MRDDLTMHCSIFTSIMLILLTSLMHTSSASVILSTEDYPLTIDTALWRPISTIWPTDTPAVSAGLTLEPAPTAVFLPPLSNDKVLPELRARQVTGQTAPVVLPSTIMQLSPITTYGAWINVNGVQQNVQVVYTQVFQPVPDQWPSPSKGSIGMGTIKGEVGKVKTKRDIPTQEPITVAITAAAMNPAVKSKSGEENRSNTMSALSKLSIFSSGMVVVVLAFALS